MKKRTAVLGLILVLAMMLTGCLGSGSDIPQTEGMLNVHFIDVGQADSILVQMPTGQSMLIDAGNNDDDQLVIDYLKKHGIKKLDYVVGTHPHEDHIGGLDKVIDTFDIGQVYLPNVSHTTKTFEDVLVSTKNKGLKIDTAKAGVSLDLENGIGVEFLAPISDKYKDLNDYSAVIQLTYGQTSFLLTGDAEGHSEEEMVKKYGNKLKSDVLKLGHHGSRTSSSEEFLQLVKPQLAIISCGKNNDYGHPHQQTMDKLNKFNIPSLRTDVEGHIVLSSDGKAIKRANGQEIIGQEVEPQPESTENKQAIMIKSIDLAEEIVILENPSDQAVDLAGYTLVSVAGDQKFVLPDNSIIVPKGTLSIVSGPKGKNGKDKILWSNENIWNNSGDPGQLYNEEGILISSFE